MIVMPANNTKWQVHFWQGIYGGLGHLYSPGGIKGPYPHLPYALDNGAFVAYTNGTEWDEPGWINHLKQAATYEQQPLFAVVPDVVADSNATLAKWDTYHDQCRALIPGVKLAIAVQDGMAPSDVPRNADMVFVGGSTEWKWSNFHRFCARFPTHVGRVNGHEDLIKCKDAGAISCDGTGWFRGDQRQLAGLERYLRENAGAHPPLVAPLIDGDWERQRKRASASPVEWPSFLDG